MKEYHEELINKLTKIAFTANRLNREIFIYMAKVTENRKINMKSCYLEFIDYTLQTTTLLTTVLTIISLVTVHNISRKFKIFYCDRSI